MHILLNFNLLIRKDYYLISFLVISFKILIMIENYLNYYFKKIWPYIYIL